MMSAQIGQLHSAYINGQNSDEENHLHKKIDNKTNVSEHTKLLDSGHHGAYAKKDDDQLEQQNFGDKPTFFFEAKSDTIPHVQIKRCGHHRFGEYHNVFEPDEYNQIGKYFATVKRGRQTKIWTYADGHEQRGHHLSHGRKRQAPFRFDKLDLTHRYVYVHEEKKIEHQIRYVVDDALTRVLKIEDGVFVLLFVSASNSKRVLEIKKKLNFISMVEVIILRNIF